MSLKSPNDAKPVKIIRKRVRLPASLWNRVDKKAKRTRTTPSKAVESALLRGLSTECPTSELTPQAAELLRMEALSRHQTMEKIASACIVETLARKLPQ